MVLVDFGMAATVGAEDGLLRGRCGTPGYVAPEILRAGVHEGYANNVDAFSSGAVLYALLCGYEPFYGDDDRQLVAANREARVEFHTSSSSSSSAPPSSDAGRQAFGGDHHDDDGSCSFSSSSRGGGGGGAESPFLSPWDGVSQEAKDVVSALLAGDPADRATPDQALAMPWFARQLGQPYAVAAVAAAAGTPEAAAVAAAAAQTAAQAVSPQPIMEAGMGPALAKASNEPANGGDNAANSPPRQKPNGEHKPGCTLS